MLIYSL